MARKSLGHVELEWICPNCDTRNPGSRRTCQSCGMPQPENVQFEQPAQEKLITDGAKLAQAQAGPDIHCYYCGTRNPATATTCSQCGADLSEGSKRTAGAVLGAHRDKAAEKIICPACGTPNEGSAAKCVQCGAALTLPAAAPPPVPAQEPVKRSAAPSRGGLLGVPILVVLALLVCACAGAFLFMSNRTEELVGTVTDLTWTRTIEMEGLVPVQREDWRDEIPAGAVVGACRQRVRNTQNQPAPNSREVCGTPYTVDSGSGFGEVVQDCKYEVFDNFCEYSVTEWRPIDDVVSRGSGFNATWPQLPAARNQRAIDREEAYRVTFTTTEGDYTYVTSNENEYARFREGSRWIIEVSGLGGVTDVRPTE